MAEGNFNLKLVPEYNGTMSVVDWLERVDLICKLSGVDEVKQVIPLRLAGGIFNIYQQLLDADKTNVTWVKAALCRAFALDPCEAYKQFSRRTLRLDESVDGFYTALKKLSTLFGRVLDQTLKYAFMAGLSVHTQELLGASADIDHFPMESILSQARAVVNNERVAATVDRSATEKVPLPKPTENSLYCFNCSGPNHLANTASLNDQGSAVSHPSNVTDGRKRATSCQNVQKTETGERYEHHSRPGKNENQPASDACVPVMRACINSLLWGVWFVAHRVGTRQKCWPLTEKVWPAGEWLVSICGWIRGPP